MPRRLAAAVLAFLIGLPALAGAQDRPGTPPGPAQSTAPANGVLALLPKDSVTEHTVVIGGVRRDYLATAGTLHLYNPSGERAAAIFYTAYALKGVPAEKRPLTFAFNGGPGAASTFLHLGVVGPKAIEFGADGRDGANARLRDNPDSWIEFTDLVLIDPIGTGWSRTAKPDDAKNFYGVRADAQMLAKTIALYVAHNARTASPKYLLGESYGGFRAVKVARALQEEQGIVVHGLVALSPLLEGALQFGASRFALGAALQFPSFVAAELERRKAYSEEALAEAERFAMTEYLTMLAGAPPEGERAREFYGRVAQMTGLPPDVVTRTRGFLREAYAKHLRASRGEVMSPYDAGFAVPDPFPESETSRMDDPILHGFTRALAGVFVGYARETLGFRTDMTYILLASDISGKWDWGGGGGSRAGASVTADLREMLALNPSLRMLIVHGTGDLVTPFGVSRYVINHLPPLGAKDRVQLKLYRGGHMFYFKPASRAVFTRDAKAFYGMAE